MARVQRVLTPAELTLVDQMAELTGSKRTEALFQHLLDRVQSRKLPASQLELLAMWLPGQAPKGKRVG